MALFPLSPTPSSVSAPTIIDPMLTFETDQRYSVRRVLTNRPRRRYTVEWLGKHTYEMRQIRDFLLQCRLGAIPFQWLHPTANEFVSAVNTTPALLDYAHGLYTGQWVVVSGSAPSAGLNGVWQVTRVGPTQIALNGT